MKLMAPGITVQSEVYFVMLSRLWRLIQTKGERCSPRASFSCVTTCGPIQWLAQGLLREQFNWNISNHAPYSPDVTANSHHHFSKMKVPGYPELETNEELMDGVNLTGYLSSVAL